MDTNKVIIAFGKKSTLNRVLAAICYATAFLLIYKYFALGENFIRINKYIALRNGVYSIFLLLLLAFKFSVNVSFHFKLDEMKYRTYYYIGPIGFGTWKKFKELHRVSTFLNNREECEVNIWDIKNNRYKIAVFDEIDSAVEYGRDLAQTLNISFKERK